jgi:hypothetical protein
LFTGLAYAGATLPLPGVYALSTATDRSFLPLFRMRIASLLYGRAVPVA